MSDTGLAPEELPKVSIITVCYNSARTIRDTIESVLSQDYPSIEYIVIDGNSTDETIDIVREYGGRISAVVSESDRGIYDAMNKGIRHSTGDIVGFLNSDDYYIDRHVIGELVGAMAMARTDAVFADLIYVDPNDPARVLRYYDSSRWTPQKFRFGWMPAHPTFFIRREWYSRLGLFSLDFKIASDFEMLVRLLHGGRASYTHVSRPVVVMRAGGTSTRNLQQRFKLNREIVSACRVNGIWTTLALVLLKAPAKVLETLKGRRAGKRRLASSR